jgi:transmembrane sensor
VREQAVAWMVHLQGGPVDDETLKQWMAWRGAHPDNELAWVSVESFCGRLRELNPILVRTALDMARRRRRRLVAMGLALLLVMAIAMGWGVAQLL